MSRGGARPGVQALLRVGAPALAALALVVVAFGEGADIEHDLQLVIPATATAGEPLPVRALVYSGLRAIEGPHLSPRDVDVELRAAGGEVLARARLLRARAGSGDVEGSLAVPAGARGVVRVRAAVRVGRDDLIAVAPLQLTAAGEGFAVEGRPLRELQQLSEARTQRMPFSPPPPTPLRSRIQGGACVPEQPCTLFVHVGEPAAALYVESTPSVSASAGATTPSPETAGIVALEVTTHGPEAQLWLRATRAGRPVARRSVRLAVAQGSAALALASPVVEAHAAPELSLGGEAGGCIVDAFRLAERQTYRWVRTGSVEDCSELQAVPFGGLGPGIHRVQARRDPFSADSAAVRVVYAKSRGQTQAEVLAALARAAHDIDASDVFAGRVFAEPGAMAPSEFAASFGYLAAILEEGIVPRPRAATGYAEARARLSETQGHLRWLALLSLALGGIGLSLTVGSRGLAASARASQLLVIAGEDERTVRKARLRTTLATVASALALLLVFVLVGLYVIARGSFPR